MKANPFLIGGAAAGGAALIALLIKAFVGGRKDPSSRLINTLPRSTLRAEAASSPSIVQAFLPPQPPKPVSRPKASTPQASP